jgi:hypothetical protein
MPLEIDMMSDSFDKMVRFLVDDQAVSNDDIRAAIDELDEDLLTARYRSAPVPFERFRLRKVLRAVALERGVGCQSSNSG